MNRSVHGVTVKQYFSSNIQ